MTSSNWKSGRIKRRLGILASLLTLCWVPIEAAQVTREVVAMGTHLEIKVTATDASDAWRAAEAAIRAVDEAETRLSTWRRESDLSRINRADIGKWVEVSPKTAEDLVFASALNRATEGAFDPGIGAMVSAWLDRTTGNLPDAAEIETLRAAVRPEHLEIEEFNVRRLHARYLLDSGAFGKGVALRNAAESGLDAGALCIDLNFGGQVMRAGLCQPIGISIADPQQRQSSAAICQLETGSLATSGNSERGIVHQSKKIGHIIDPRSGHASPFGGSVTVKSNDPVVADALSTALFVMGPEVGRDWVQSTTDFEIEALWIGTNGEIIWATPDFEIEETVG